VHSLTVKMDFADLFKAWLRKLNIQADKVDELWETFQKKQRELVSKMSLDECERLMAKIESRQT